MISLDITSNDTTSKSFTVNVLDPVSSLNLGFLPERFYDSLIVINVSSEVAENLSNTYYLVTYGNEVGNYIPKDGVLFRIDATRFGIVDFNPKKTRSSLSLTWNNDVHDMETTIDQCEPLYDASGPEARDSVFSMKPPANTNLPKPQAVSPEQIIEPLVYVKQRYYNILYSPSMPLSYFPKTAISRLKVLAKDKTAFKKHLFTLLLPQEQLNQRHTGEYGVLKKINGSDGALDTEFEVDVQSGFLTSQNLTSNSSRITEFVFQFKLREFQLQLIILLEILIALELIEDEFLFKNTQSPKSTSSAGSQMKQPPIKARPSLIRKKNKPRKIIPTFLGMGVGMTSPVSTKIDAGSVPIGEDVSTFELLHILNNLIERLRLLDTLSAETDPLINFVAYVLVPYYKNKLPLVIKYIIDRIKESNFKVKKREPSSRSRDPRTRGGDPRAPRSKDRDPRTRDRDSKTTKQDSIRSRSSSVSSTTSSSSATSSQPERPKLTLADGTFGPKSLKRSSSNLSSKNLQRRQVDFSSLKSKSMTELNTSIFGQARKKSVNMSESSSLITSKATVLESQPKLQRQVSQVMATPIKPKKSFTGMTASSSTGPASGSASGPSLGPALQISQTPIKPNQPSSPILSPISERIKATPISNRASSSSQKNASLGEKLSFDESILSSPIVSSKKRPGEPVEFMDPGFGSPLQSVFKRARKKS